MAETNKERLLLYALEFEPNFLQAQECHNEMEWVERKSADCFEVHPGRQVPYPDIFVWECSDCGTTSECGIPEHIPEVDVRSWIDKQTEIETEKHNAQVTSLYLQREAWWNHRQRLEEESHG